MCHNDNVTIYNANDLGGNEELSGTYCNGTLVDVYTILHQMKLNINIQNAQTEYQAFGRRYNAPYCIYSHS